MNRFAVPAPTLPRIEKRGTCPIDIAKRPAPSMSSRARAVRGVLGDILALIAIAAESIWDATFHPDSDQGGDE